jgi:hypothetical protein
MRLGGSLIKSRAKVVDKNAAGVAYLMKQNKVDVFNGRGTVLAPGSVEVTSADGKKQKLEAKNIILATGSVVRNLPFLKVDGKHVVTSDEILELDHIPKSLLVLGGGAVGWRSSRRTAMVKTTDVTSGSHVAPSFRMVRAPDALPAASSRTTSAVHARALSRAKATRILRGPRSVNGSLPRRSAIFARSTSAEAHERASALTSVTSAIASTHPE